MYKNNYDNQSRSKQELKNKPQIQSWFFPEWEEIDYDGLSQELLSLIGNKKIYLYSSIHAPKLIDRVYFAKDRLEKEYGIKGIVIGQTVYRTREYYRMLILINIDKRSFKYVLKFLDRFCSHSFIICSNRLASADYERWQFIRKHEISPIHQGYDDIPLDNEACIYMLYSNGGNNVYYLDAVSNN